jgi:hypothetical protein
MISLASQIISVVSGLDIIQHMLKIGKISNGTTLMIQIALRLRRRELFLTLLIICSIEEETMLT